MKQRHNITLTPGMDERLTQYAYQSRKSRSAVIEEALDQYLSGSSEEPQSTNTDMISLLEERINRVESKLKKIESNETPNPASFRTKIIQVPEIIPPVVTETYNDSDNQTAITLDPEGWYSQSLVGEFLDPTILLSTRKSIVSLAVARGEMETNGKKRKGCRIKGSSAIAWITSMKRKEKPPIFFLGSS